MAAQHESYLSLLQLKVRRIQFQALRNGYVRILQKLGVGGLAGTPQKGDRQFVVGLHLLGIPVDL